MRRSRDLTENFLYPITVRLDLAAKRVFHGRKLKVSGAPKIYSLYFYPKRPILGRMKSVAVYVRVSTFGQNEESQVNELEAYCSAHGMKPVFFIDKATGTNLRRPAFEKLEAALFDGQFDTVVVYKIDRLSRSLLDGITVLSKWLTGGVRLVATSQRFDFSGTVGNEADPENRARG